MIPMVGTIMGPEPGCAHHNVANGTFEILER
jgi:hypothetical protein